MEKSILTHGQNIVFFITGSQNWSDAGVDTNDEESYVFEGGPFVLDGRKRFAYAWYESRAPPRRSELSSEHCVCYVCRSSRVFPALSPLSTSPHPPRIPPAPNDGGAAPQPSTTTPSSAKRARKRLLPLPDPSSTPTSYPAQPSGLRSGFTFGVPFPRWFLDVPVFNNRAWHTGSEYHQRFIR